MRKLLHGFIQHCNAFLKQNIYKPNLATHCLNNKPQFLDIQSLKLIKNIQKAKNEYLEKKIYEIIRRCV